MSTTGNHMLFGFTLRRCLQLFLVSYLGVIIVLTSSSIKRSLLLVLLSYLGVIVVFMFIENRLLFLPVRASEDWISPAYFSLKVEDVTLTSADGTRLHGWWCPLPEGTTAAPGAVLHCHGNAGNLSHRIYAIAEWQQSLRMPIFIFDYPGYGKSEGKPSEQGCYAAGDAAYDWLTQTKGIAPENILLYGDSLGGGVAVELARRRPHRALLLVRVFTSIPDMAQLHFPWLPARWLVRNRFDNLEKIGHCPRPIFLAHGDCDTIVPCSYGQQVFAKAPEPKQFFLMEGCDHNDPLGPDFHAALRDFLKNKAPAK